MRRPHRHPGSHVDHILRDFDLLDSLLILVLLFCNRGAQQLKMPYSFGNKTRDNEKSRMQAGRRNKTLARLRRTIGPGLMFASTAIGVSHLVQSTRAGATYSYAVLWAVLLANLLKYPAFEYGSRYANATGESLIDGYKRFGNWALYVYLFITVSPMSIIIAAICFTTAGLLNNLLGLHLPVIYTSFAVIFGCVGILFIGTYRTLDGMIKIICTVLFLSTLTAFVLTLARGPNVPVIFYSDAGWTASGFAFIIALMGWMPALWLKFSARREIPVF